MGTRHRAAIGISENSDAAVVVVSEETGIISIAVNGEIKRNYNMITLHEELTKLLFVDENGNGGDNFFGKVRNKTKRFIFGEK